MLKFSARLLTTLVGLGLGTAAGAHVSPNLGLFEVQRTITITSATLTIEHTARLRSGVLITPATRRILDEDSSGDISERELGGFLQHTALHLSEDLILLAGRRGPDETTESMDNEPLFNTVLSYAPLTPADGPSSGSLGLGFRQKIQVEFPEYLTRPLKPRSFPEASLSLELIDPCFMVTIRGLGSAGPNLTTGTQLLVPDSSIKTVPPAGPVPHELSLRLILAKTQPAQVASQP